MRAHNRFLDCLPTQPPYDREAMQATLYRKQGKRSEAAKLLEGKLLHGANDCFNALLSLAEIALEEGNGVLADTLADTAQHTVRSMGCASIWHMPCRFSLRRRARMQSSASRS